MLQFLNLYQTRHKHIQATRVLLFKNMHCIREILRIYMIFCTNALIIIWSDISLMRSVYKCSMYLYYKLPSDRLSLFRRSVNR